MSNVVSSRVEAIRVGDEHADLLAAFYRRVWNPDANAEDVIASRASAARTNVVAPGEPPPTWLVVQDGAAIAHVTTIPITLWLEGREQPSYWMKGLWVLPEVQRSAAGFLVLRAAVAALEVPTLALVHEPAAIRLFQALKYVDLGPLPNQLRVLRPAAVLSRLGAGRLGSGQLPTQVRRFMPALALVAPIIGPVMGVAGDLWAAARSGSLRGIAIDVSDSIDTAEVDGLWRSVRTELAAAPVRDGAYLFSRYRSSQYCFVHARTADGLVGLAVLKRPNEESDPRIGGLRIATIADLLVRPTARQTLFALLRAAERVAKRFNADALLSSGGAAVVDDAARERGYLRLPPNLRVLAKVPGGKANVPRELCRWWVTRGDSEGDGTF